MGHSKSKSPIYDSISETTVTMWKYGEKPKYVILHPNTYRLLCLETAKWAYVPPDVMNNKFPKGVVSIQTEVCKLDIYESLHVPMGTFHIHTQRSFDELQSGQFFPLGYGPKYATND